MKYIKISFLALVTLVTTSCNSKNKKVEKKAIEPITQTNQDLSKYETAYFASGCFWCVEAIFESVKGVKEVVSGYSGGTEKNPTYKQVSYGKTTHAEAVKVYYDPKVISFNDLVKVYFGSHDPTTVDGQGPDMGKQYRSIAFYKNENEKKSIESYMAKIKASKIYSKPLATQVVKFTKFYDAEDYHQDFEKNNPNQSYIKAVSVPRLKRFQKSYPELLKKDAHH
ncbi:peptide-methionine (S)-S-oxide reductase MsrA [Cellulophaga baltica]|uniref:peptide-methionine (S)-S-oxide reductase MsrA n=1 Tax=Cellulophaga TaxID=104264 RepID=UPI001C07032B|nr:MULTISPECIES: peptide-methionine (S)-S-oxide reductase MsrA [Cellulophaga]MBU2996568.1 peptide-methionine (S)-S-oxide reductase MsrA [Cellulophaga baltica]MDO6767962.1 peptide-methionine (S)-S-oxide reductase MsrA [Cellulophaga sp. 1_MG-2023]